MKKRGYSQIEMVLAFLIFISVAIFVIYLLGVGKNTEKTSIALDSLKQKIMKNITTVVISASLKLNTTAGRDIQINLTVPAGYNPIVRNLSGEKLYAWVCNSNFICLRTVTGKDSLKILLSEDFPLVTPLTDEDANYSLGPPFTNEILSEKKAKSLNDSYSLQYNSLRKYFSVSKEFSFSIRNISEVIIQPSKVIPSGVQIYKINERKELLREDGRIEFVSLEVSIW